MTDQLSNPAGRTPVVPAPSGVPVPAPEADLRAIAESSREREWRKPSFAKELYLGRFRLDLIHPHPRVDADDVERGEEFLAGCARSARRVDGAGHRARGADPGRLRQRARELGAFGMKIPREYGGLGLSHVYYNRALMLAGSAHSEHRRAAVARTSRSASRSR